MSLLEPFIRHPAAVGESYGEHLVFASSIGTRLLLAGLACLAHGLCPFLFERTGSRAILEVSRRLTGGARAAWLTVGDAPSRQVGHTA